MIPTLVESIRQQFGAAISMLENAIRACPDDLWSDQSKGHDYWYRVYHTLFWLDLYLYGSIEGFEPPKPFGLEELDPAGLIPDRVYTKTEMLDYLEHNRGKLQSILDSLNEEEADSRCAFGWGREVSYAELLLYNMRHVQHHTGQLNLILRQEIDSAPRWVGRVTKGG
jgi:hypothetical protein